MCAELEEVKSLRIVAVTLDSKLTLEIHLRKVVSKTARSLSVVRRAAKLFACPLLLKSTFNVHCFFQLGLLCPRVDVVGGI